MTLCIICGKLNFLAKPWPHLISRNTQIGGKNKHDDLWFLFLKKKENGIANQNSCYTRLYWVEHLGSSSNLPSSIKSNPHVHRNCWWTQKQAACFNIFFQEQKLNFVTNLGQTDQLPELNIDKKEKMDPILHFIPSNFLFL